MIALEKIQLKDLTLIMEWRMNKEISKYMYTDPKLNLESQKVWFDKINKDKKCKYWIIKYDEVRIGVINLNNIDILNKRCSWEYYIGEINYRGKGIAKIIEYSIYEYVFECLGFNKIWCELMKFNNHAISIHEKMGAEIEGEFKEHILKEDIFYDVIIMGITKTKWINIKKNYNFEKIYIEK